MTTAFTAFYDNVLPHVPGCLESVAMQAIRDSAIEFCERTWAMQGDHTPIDIVAAQASYPYVPPAGKLVCRRLEVWYADDPLIDASPDRMKDVYGRKWKTQTGLPKYHTATSARAMILVPYPAEALTAGLTLRVAYKPTSAATTIDDEIYEEYREIIAAGARMRLMLSQKKPYSNAKQAGIESEFYRSGMGRVKRMVQRGLGRAQSNVKGHFF